MRLSIRKYASGPILCHHQAGANKPKVSICWLLFLWQSGRSGQTTHSRTGSIPHI